MKIDMFTGHIQLGRKSLPADSNLQHSRSSTITNLDQNPTARNKLNVRKSLSGTNTTLNVKQKQSVNNGRKSLPASSNKGGVNVTNVRSLVKPVVRSLPFVGKQSKPSVVKGSSTAKGTVNTNTRKSISETEDLPNPKQTMTGGRKGLPATADKSNAKITQPVGRKSFLGKSASGNCPTSADNNSTRLNTQHTGATNNSSKLQMKNTKSGAVLNRKSNAKPRRSILKPYTDRKITSNVNIYTAIKKEYEFEVGKVLNKENIRDDKIEIIKQTSKSVHFISPCTTPRLKTTGGTPLKTPTKEPSMR